jgi:transposase
MQTITIRLDLAKSVFQVHGVDAAGQVTLRKKLRRSEVMRFFEVQPPCLVGMEACATAHHWARELSALGHEVRLMPAAYVKAYVRRQKNDDADAEAICESMTRPTMRFVPVKSAERQSVLVLHRTRELLVRQRTRLINAIRGHCAEFGMIVAQGARRVSDLIEQVRQAAMSALPEMARSAVLMMADQLDALAAADSRPRPLAPGLASPGPGQPAARHHPWRGDHHRHRTVGFDTRSEPLPIRPGVRRLPWTGPTPEFLRR